MSVAVVVGVAVSLVFGANPDPRLRTGVALHDAGDLRGAITVYRSILKDRPNDPATVYELGYSLVAHQEYQAALEVIDQARKSKTEQSPRLFALQANALDAKGDHPGAEAALRAGLEADPLNPELHYSLGVNLGTQERWAEAEPAFLAAVVRGPEQPSGWWGLGRAFEALGKRERAAVAYARSATLQGDLARAKAAAERVVKLLEPPDASALARSLAEVDGDDDAFIELARPFFTEARSKGHLETLAYELQRLSGDAAADVWHAQNVARVRAWREWVMSFNLRMLRTARAPKAPAP